MVAVPLPGLATLDAQRSNLPLNDALFNIAYALYVNYIHMSMPLAPLTFLNNYL